MNRMILPSKKIKYIKLCIISPHYEIIVNLAYIIFFFLLAFYLLSMGSNISNYHINLFIEETFRKEAFSRIKTDYALNEYIEKLVYSLYNYSPSSKLNFIIPFGSIRLKKYTHRQKECPYENAPKCSDFSCTIREIGRLYSSDLHCGYPYRKKYSDNPSLQLNSVYISLTRDYEGKYGYYDLVNYGENMDFTIDEYKKDEVKAFIQDKQLKFIAIMFNVYFPTNDNYALVLAGFEMIHYFTFLQPIFTSTAYVFFNSSSPYFISIYVFFSISVALTLIKLIYEINVKFMFTVHLFMFLNEAVNLLFIIFISFYFSSVNEENYLLTSASNTKDFKDNMPTLITLSYLQIIISMLFLCIPFRVLSLISWYQPISIHLIKYFSSIFRILPGVLVFSTLTVMLILVFTFTNFFMYNNDIFLCKNLFNSLVNIFNTQMIRDINLSRSIDHSMLTSKYFLLFNVLQIFIFLLVLTIGIATIVYLFRKAAKIETDKDNDDVLDKLGEIEGKLTDEVENYTDNLKGMKKQILWLNLDNKNDLYAFYAEKQRVLLFKKANHVIAFLKYLFAIKPDMQFKKLEAKFGLVLECKVVNGIVKESELEQIYSLLDWLNFVGCKIPAVLYTVDRLERNLRMKIATCYILLKFISQRDDLSAFLHEHINRHEEEEKNKKEDINHMIAPCDRFMIYPSHNNAVPDKKTIKRNISIANSNLNKSNADEDSGTQSYLSQGKPNFVKQLTKKGTMESINKSSNTANNGANVINANPLNNGNSSNGNTTLAPRQNNFFQQKSIGYGLKEKDTILHLNQSISEERVDDSDSGKPKSSS